jgi:formylglycine-generating enzyme required for sulfatase activity
MKKLLILSLLALGYQTASATSLLEAFGSGENAFVMEFVTIGNPGNAADTTVVPTGSNHPAGSVAYTYNIGMYEVSRNMITSANSDGNLGITMYDMTNYNGNGGNQPATGLTWNEAAIFVNWLNTSTGGTAAYKFSGGTFQLWSPTDAGYNAKNMFRNSLAKYVIPSSDEWFKAAYGNLDGTWNDYPNGSDSLPMAVASGTAENTAVYNNQSGPADIYNAGGLSPYGTMAQGGNVFEWMETAFDGINFPADRTREIRGNSWYGPVSDGSNNYSNSGWRIEGEPTDADGGVGFRVAMIPEPSSLSLLVLGGAVVALRRRR